MNILRKLGKTLLALVMLFSALLSNFGNIGGKAQAATFFVDEASLRSKGTYAGSITYNGVEIATTYVYYLKNGKEYPAYCISPGADGVGEYGNYNVSVGSLLTDVNIWRVITNGYPYKSASELGCNSADEAFVATKHAVYCAILGREASWYGAIGEKGVRVKNAMSQILAAARSGSSGKPSSNIEINALDSDWKLDTNLPNYISQTFSITASTTYDTYSVSLVGDNPEETRVFDANNNPKTTFTSGEKFKIAIPLKDLNKTGSFKIKVSTKLNTKPVLYGKAPTGSGLQDYALTASVYEDAEGTKTLNYVKNGTSLEILKQDSKTLKALEGVEFRILDSNKKPVYTNLVTNNKGIVTVNGLIPGKYYLEEVKTLDGYVKYDKQIAFDIEYNQTLTITVNNSLEKKSEQLSNTQKINVSQNKEEIVVKDNQETITKTGNEKVTNIVNTVKNVSENENNIKELQNTGIENNTKNSNITDTLNKLSIENKNIDYNKLVQALRTLVDNESVNVNKNIQNQDIQINNANKNLNENIQKKDTQINNVNKNLNENIQNELTNIKNENDNSNLNMQIQNTEVKNDNKNNNLNSQVENLNMQNISRNLTSNVKTQNTNRNTQTVSTNIVNSNQNTNINTQNVETGIENVNQNVNNNISSYNGVIKLPKTGM